MRCVSNLFFFFVSIVEPPRIITHPQTLKDSVAGNPAKFTIQAIGTEPLNYYWQWKTIEKSADSQEWQPCDEGWCDGTTLTIPCVQKLNEGSYCCVISNSAGSQISKVAQLSVGKDAMFKCLKSVKCVLVSTSILVSLDTYLILSEGGIQIHHFFPMSLLCFNIVVEPPRITTHPQDIKDIVGGKTAMFTIQATGTEPLNYNWQWKPDEKGGRSEEWQPCTAKGSDGTTLTIPSVQKLNEGSYCCVISNCAGTQISEPAQLTISKLICLS